MSDKNAEPREGAAALPLSKRLPPALISFLEVNGVPLTAYDNADTLPRFVRISSRAPDGADEFFEEVDIPRVPVKWLPGFYELPSSVGISGTKAYKSGKIYGIDVSSGAAIAALAPQSGDRVLDICCAPGAKLCMIADYVGLDGCVVGVDVSLPRLTACKTMLKKYKTTNTVLMLGDGALFPQQCSRLDEAAKRRNKKKRSMRESDRELFYQSLDTPFDKVIVDAECTHDGSVKHLLKYERNWGWEALEEKFLGHKNMERVTTTQLALLRNGFQRVKEGGSLVYSTCSLSRTQNESVVLDMLKAEPLAELVPVDLAATAPCRPGFVEHTVRFDPGSSKTSGLFIAKFTKKHNGD